MNVPKDGITAAAIRNVLTLLVVFYADATVAILEMAPPALVSEIVGVQFAQKIRYRNLENFQLVRGNFFVHAVELLFSLRVTRTFLGSSIPTFGP